MAPSPAIARKVHRLHELNVERRALKAKLEQLDEKRQPLIDEISSSVAVGETVRYRGITMVWRQTRQSRPSMPKLVDRLRARMSGKALAALEADVAAAVTPVGWYWIELVDAKPTSKAA